MGNPFEDLPSTPAVEPGICAACKAVYEVPQGVASQCSTHDPPGQIVTVPLLFKVLGPALQGKDALQNPQTRLCFDLLKRLQDAIMAKKDEPAPPTS